MEKFMEAVHGIFANVVEILILLIEIVSVIILIKTVIKTIVAVVKSEKHIGIPLAEGMALALEVAMCGEFLHTVIEKDWQSLLILGATILLRAVMSILLHFEKEAEIKHAQRQKENTTPQP